MNKCKCRGVARYWDWQQSGGEHLVADADEVGSLRQVFCQHLRVGLWVGERARAALRPHKNKKNGDRPFLEEEVGRADGNF